MEQNINLLEHKMAFSSVKYASLKFFALIVIVFCTLLMIFYFFNLSLYKKNSTKLTQLTLVKEKAKQQITELRKQIAQQSKDSATSNSSSTLVLTTPFLPYLEKLAMYIPYGIWLRTISLGQQKNIFTFTLNGKSISVNLLPQFIRIIEQKRIFNSEKTFNLSLQKDEKNNLVVFALDNSKRQQK